MIIKAAGSGLTDCGHRLFFCLEQRVEIDEMKSNLKFTKMQGAGNDFIVADDTIGSWPRSADFIAGLCDRRRGVGADGLILLSPLAMRSSDDTPSPARLKMDFFNSDGGAADMCGNGLRCAALFAVKRLNAASDMLFETGAGELSAEVLSDNLVRVDIPLRSQPIKITVDGFECCLVDTGVPHLVVEVDDLSSLDVSTIGCRLRSHPALGSDGANVDFVDFSVDPRAIRTFERGVEGETQACGTGVAAAAVCAAFFSGKRPPLDFKTVGGDILSVDFSWDEGIVPNETSLYLTGPSVEVFSGEITV